GASSGCVRPAGDGMFCLLAAIRRNPHGPRLHKLSTPKAPPPCPALNPHAQVVAEKPSPLAGEGCSLHPRSRMGEGGEWVRGLPPPGRDLRTIRRSPPPQGERLLQQTPAPAPPRVAPPAGGPTFNVFRGELRRGAESPAAHDTAGTL